MTIKELKKVIETEVEHLPEFYSDKIYDAATLDEGIAEVIDYGKRCAYSNVLKWMDWK